jgi:hypothetical protein
VHHDVRPQLQRPCQHGRGERVVDGQQQTVPLRQFGTVQRLLQILDQILGVLDAARQADHVVGNAEAAAVFGLA